MGLMKKLTSSIVASSLVLGLVGTAFAAPTADQTNNAFERLSHYNIAKGKVLLDGTIDPALNDSITRAELVTVITRAFGQEETAKILAGAASFNDVATNEWYSGYVALAKNMAEKQGFPIGYEDGTFQPNKQVSAVEALAFIMKYLGVKPATGANWAADTVKAATEAGVITTADAEAYLADLNAPATRGLAFGLADTIFGSYNKLAGGKTVYTAFVDTQAPVVTLDKVEATTAATTKISGKVSGDYTEVYIGTEKITVNEDGTFTAEVKLAVGENAISVIAKDLAGNEGVGTTTVTRTVGVAAAIEATLGASEIVAGGQTDLTIKVVDANGGEVTVPAADIKVTSTLGAYADGKFTAGTKAGAGTITATYGDFTKAVDLKVVAGELAKVGAESESVAPGGAVKLLAMDQYGNAIEGATFAETSDKAFIDGAMFTATEAGQYTVTAKVGEKSVEGTIGVYGDAAKFAIEAPKAMVANGETEYEIVVKAVDEKGNLVSSFDEEVALESDLEGDTVVKSVNGVATFTVTVPVGLEDVDLDLTASSEDPDIESTTTITAAAQTATAIDIDANKFLGVNDAAVPFEGTISILDQEGVAMKNAEVWEVELKVSGPAYLGDDEETDLTIDANGDGVTFPLVAKDVAEGDVTVTASAAGLDGATATVRAAYAYAAKNVVIEQITDEAVAANDEGISYFKVGLTDRNGVPVLPTEDTEVTLSFATSAYDELTVATGTSKDLAKTAVEAKLAEADHTLTGKTTKVTIEVTNPVTPYVYVAVTGHKLVGDVSFTASAKDLASANGSVSFKTGELAGIVFKSEAIDESATLSILPNSDTALTAQLVDGALNPVAKALKVEFTANSDKVELNGKEKVTVTTNADGKAEVKATVKAYSNPTPAFTVTANVDADNNGTVVAGEMDQTVTLTVAPSVAKSISVTTYKVSKGRNAENTADIEVFGKTSTFDYGDVIEIRANVTDNNGLAMADSEVYDGSTLALDEAFTDKVAYGVADVTAPVDNTDFAFTWNEAGYWTARATAKDAGTLVAKVTDSSSVFSVEGSRTVAIRSGAPADLKIAEAEETTEAGYDGEITITRDKVAALTVQIVDGAKNVILGSKSAGYEISAKFEEADATGGDIGYYSIRTSEAGGGGDEATLEVAKLKNNAKFYVITNDSLTADPEDASKAKLTLTYTPSEGTAWTYTLLVNVVE